MATQAELEQRIKDLERKLAELQGEDEGRGIFSMMDALFPPETRQHMRAARKEQLLAFRSLIDRWIARIDEDRATPKRESIRVD